MADIRTKLSPPWVTYANMLKALFDPDPEIDVVYKDNLKAVYLYVDNPEKAAVLSELLPETKWIGIDLAIKVIPSNSETVVFDMEQSNKTIMDTAFSGNPVYAYSVEVEGFFGNVITYVVFKNKVVQFFNDNLNDIHGITSTLYEDIAESIFEDADLDGVFYNTDVEEKLDMPKGKWL